MPAELILDARNIVGESLVWDDRRGAFLWVDIIKKRIHYLEIKTKKHTSWSAPDLVTSVGLRADGGAVVGLSNTICNWAFGGPFTPFATIEADKPGNRLNEGVVGPDGAFWVGTMQNNIAPDGAPVDITEDTGRIYRCLPDCSVETLSTDTFGITNTFVWTNDGAFITADTMRNEIYRYAMDPETRQLSDRTIISAGFERGLPDGSCVDEEGFIWNCRVVGGACLLRLAPDGTIDRVVDLPCSWPTSCAFGGENLDRLFVTSARFTMSEDHLEAVPHEGGLFAVDVGVRGVQPNRFG